VATPLGLLKLGQQASGWAGKQNGWVSKQVAGSVDIRICSEYRVVEK